MTTQFRQIKEAIWKARTAARNTTKRQYRFVWSRGTNLTAVDARGDTIVSEGDGHFWTGQMKDLKRFLSLHPAAVSVTVQGGYDGGSEMSDLAAGCYDPMVSTWAVEVWRKDSGFGVYEQGVK